MMQQQMLSLAQIVDKTQGTNIAEQIAAGVMGQAAPVAVGGDNPVDNVGKTEALGGEGKAESSITKNARKRVAESTSPT